MIRSYILMKVKNPVSQIIRIFTKINQKSICKTEKFKLFKVHSFTFHHLAGALLA